MMRPNPFVLRVALLLGLPGGLSPSCQAQVQSEQVRFVKQLCHALLGQDDPFVDLGGGGGWRGVLLAAPGSSLAPLTEAYNGVAGDLSQTLAQAAVFDRPVQASNGTAVLGPRPLNQIWSEILDQSRPSDPLPRDKMLKTAVMKWLFKPIVKRGVTTGYTREPSRYVVRYNYFDSIYAQLLKGKESGLWRLDRRLTRFTTYENASSWLMAEWLKSGFKAEVESARWSFDASLANAGWLAWARASHDFTSHTVPIDLYTKLPETYLLPPPASWSSVSSWIRLSVVTTNGGVYGLQISRIRVARPWFDIDSLVSGSLKLDYVSSGTEPLVSDGTSPTLDKLPNGNLPAYIEEILIVRDITYTGPPSEHPLGVFAYPNALNIIGFVVRVLPKIEAVDQKSATGEAANTRDSLSPVSR